MGDSKFVSDVEFEEEIYQLFTDAHFISNNADADWNEIELEDFYSHSESNPTITIRDTADEMDIEVNAAIRNKELTRCPLICMDEGELKCCNAEADN